MLRGSGERRDTANRISFSRPALCLLFQRSGDAPIHPCAGGMPQAEERQQEEIAKQKNQIAQQEGKIAQQEGKIAQQEDEIESLKKAQEHKDAEIARLQALLDKR